MVLKKIKISSQADQRWMYSLSNSARRAKDVSFLPETCHKPRHARSDPDVLLERFPVEFTLI